ncbi:uncharacterized protein DUF4184 [Micromonospora sp. M71_S20]|nr:uncharacterized protein DUF4184 [Micromonospora sp. M71_S20]
MPLTFPSHLAVVLPLKLWRPRWFDGVALCTGAMSPDMAYLLMGTRWEVAGTHTVTGLLWWCLPVALVYAWLVRQCAAVVAPHLPASTTFHWPEYAMLSSVRHRWWVTIASALLGSASHLGWDFLTHTDGWLRALGVDWYAATGVHWWTVSDLTSTAIGGAVVVGLARHVPRLHTPVDQRRPAWPAVFYSVGATTLALGVMVLPQLPASRHVAASGVRLLHVLAFSLLAGGVCVTASTRRRSDRLNGKRP